MFLAPSTTNTSSEKSGSDLRPQIGTTRRPCSTSIRISFGPSSNAHLAFFQSDTSGRDNYRHIVVEVTGDEANVKLKMIPEIPRPVGASIGPPSTTSDARPCGRELTVDKWKQLIAGAHEIGTVMAANSNLRARFTQAASNQLWSGTNGLFESILISIVAKWSASNCCDYD